MSNTAVIIIAAWSAEALLSDRILRWYASEYEMPVEPNIIAVFVFAPIFFPILLFFFLKDQLLYRGILFYIRLLEMKIHLIRLWLKLRIKTRKLWRRVKSGRTAETR